MDERIIRFIKALRSAGVRVSLAESADAFRAVEALGVSSRVTFRTSLAATLVKEAIDQPKFEELFPLFFAEGETPPLADINMKLTPEELNQLQEALQKYNRERLRRLLERLMDGKGLTEEELSDLAQQVGMEGADGLRYRDWMAQRMARALGFDALRHVLAELMDALEKAGMSPERAQEVRDLFTGNQDALLEQLRNFAGQRIAEQMSERKPEESQDGLLNRSFSGLSEHEIDLLRKETRRLANALRTRIALRQKRAKSGGLDAKATIRANLRNDSVPIDLRHHDRILKPKLVAICDISTSMRSCSEFMLGLLYALQGQISKTHAFAFIDHLEYISPDFSEQHEANLAVEQVMYRLPSGHYNTDLGNSLQNFYDNFLDVLDNRTTFIVVGDGRNNYNNPRIDLFQTLKRRARKMIWLNPESQAQWRQGDSDMLQYAPLCDHVFQVSNMIELAAAVDRLLI